MTLVSNSTGEPSDFPFLHDEGFMIWLRSQDPNQPDWWESEYTGHTEFAYSAYCAGKIAGEKKS